jgi:hypothetical protein
LAVLLIFIGGKVFVADLIGLEKFPPPPGTTVKLRDNIRGFAPA